MLNLGQPSADAFKTALGWLTLEEAAWAGQAIAVYAAGLWPLANPSSSVQAISQLPEFEYIKFDFEAKMAEFIETLLLGCQTR